MTLTYKWIINSLEKRDNPALGLNGVVIRVFSELEGSDEDGNVGKFNIGTEFSPYEVDLDSFTLFEDLTEAQVIGWVQALVDADLEFKAHIENYIQNQIDQIKLPSEEVSKDNFPWLDTDDTT